MSDCGDILGFILIKKNLLASIIIKLFSHCFVVVRKTNLTYWRDCPVCLTDTKGGKNIINLCRDNVLEGASQGFKRKTFDATKQLVWDS